jgi:polysaccharide export outer membrane protein
MTIPSGSGKAQTMKSPHWFMLLSMLASALALGGEPGGVVSADMALPAPEGRGAMLDGYVLGPEDVIQVFVWKEPDLSTTVIVRPDGRITLPLAGEMNVVGKTAPELSTEVAVRLRKFIELPVVTVMVKEINSPKITVLGEVKKPGRHVVRQRVTILDAIAMSGGFTEFAHPKRVVVLRTTADGSERIRVDVKELLQDGGDMIYLAPGDTVDVD